MRRSGHKDAGPIPFKSYARERDSSPRFHIRRVKNTQRIYPAHKHDYAFKKSGVTPSAYRVKRGLTEAAGMLASS
jgi:hypothetical protein